MHHRGPIPAIVIPILFTASTFAQSATEKVEQQLVHATDSLHTRIQRTLEEQFSLLHDMRESSCDTSDLWAFTERAMELRMLLTAHTDTVRTLNDRLIKKEPSAALFSSFIDLGAGERMLEGLYTGLHELTTLCFDATCRQDASTFTRTLFADPPVQDDVIRTFYNIPAFALDAVLLKHQVEVERVTLAVLRSHHGQCP